MDRPISAYFVVWGERCNPDEITRRTGITPDEVWNVGDVRNRRTGTRHADSGWRVNASSSLGINVGDYIEHLLQRLLSARDYFSTLKDSCRMQISVVVRCREQAPAFYVSPDVVNQLAALGVALDVDLYC